MTIASRAVLRDKYYVTGIFPSAVHLQSMKVFWQTGTTYRELSFGILKVFSASNHEVNGQEWRIIGANALCIEISKTVKQRKQAGSSGRCL